jgi:hypothetical protein
LVSTFQGSMSMALASVFLPALGSPMSCNPNRIRSPCVMQEGRAQGVQGESCCWAPPREGLGRARGPPCDHPKGPPP